MVENNIENLIQQLNQLNIKQQHIQRQQTEIIHQLLNYQNNNETPISNIKQQKTNIPTTATAVRPIRKGDWVRVNNPKPTQLKVGKVAKIGSYYITVKGDDGREINRIPNNLTLLQQNVETD